MPSNNDKYKTEELAQEAVALRELHGRLKEALHSGNVRHQTKIPTKKEMIGLGTVFTKLKDDAIRLAKLRDKKDDKAAGKTSTGKLRVVTVDTQLAEFLGLPARGFQRVRLADGRDVWAYPDTLVTSFFTNWAVANGLQRGKVISLDGPAGEQFKRLFSDNLKALGSGPKVKETGALTAVLDANGNQINEFHMNKHMFVFAPHYPQVNKHVGNKYEKGREVIPRDEHPALYDQMQREHALLTDELKSARLKFKEAQENLAKLNLKREKALQLGDRTVPDMIRNAETEMRLAKQNYLSLLTRNRIPHSIQ